MKSFFSKRFSSVKTYPGLVLFVICCLLQTSLLQANNEKIDSLKNLLNTPVHDTIRIKALIDLGEKYYYIDQETAKTYYTEAKNFALKNSEKNPKHRDIFLKLKAVALTQIGYIHRSQGNFVEASETYFKVLDIGNTIYNDDIIFDGYNSIGIINHLRKEYSIAEKYYKLAMEVAERTENIIAKSRMLNNFGVLYYDYGNNTDSIPLKMEYYEKALRNYLEMLDIRVRLNDLRGQVICYNNLGNVTSQKATFLENENHIRQELHKAINYYQKAYAIAEKLNDLTHLSRATGNLADVYLVKYEKYKNVSSNERKAFVDSIEFYISESYKHAKELGSLLQKNAVSEMAMGIFHKVGNSDKALEYAKIYINTKEQIFSEEKERYIDEMNIRYETEKKESEIKLLNSENQIINLKVNKATRERNLYIIIAFSFFILSGLIYKLYYNRKKTEKILATKNKDLKFLNTTKDKFISILAHDLKNPISAFGNIAETLETDFDKLDNEKKKTCIQQLNRSSKQLNTLLKNMLEWALIKNKHSETEIDKLDVRHISEEAIKSISSLSSGKNINIINSIPSGIIVNANKLYAVSVFNNLVTNAVKFSKNNSPVVVSATKNDKEVIISVEDKGIGISEDDIKKLFRIDVDASTIGRAEEKGTGMGLILSKEFIDKMNGKIWIKSKPGEGSTFFFTLPLV